MTVDEFCKWIESSGFKDGARLPSVRKVAASQGASTFTVFQAYKRLVEQGKIYGEHGNGYFWGQKPEIVVDAGEHETERLERLLLEDWKSGKISVDSTLPSIKDLCTVYRTTSGSMSRTLEMLRERGVLDRKGRGRYYFKNTRSSSAKLKEILLIMRCNPNGDFNGLGERELTFMQKVYAEARRNKLKVKALGYYENEGLFLDAAGNRVRLEDCGEYFGAVVSTMLVFNINKLFALLACTRFPISVWWEHPLYDIPRALKKEKRYAFFNLAFGDFPGRAVGHFLKERGMERVAFISPYHMSMWSRDRLTWCLSTIPTTATATAWIPLSSASMPLPSNPYSTWYPLVLLCIKKTILGSFRGMWWKNDVFFCQPLITKSSHFFFRLSTSYFLLFYI